MDIPTYRKKHGLSQLAFARLLTECGSPATQGLISHWEKGLVTIPAERAVEIERATGGAVKRSCLREDLWPKRAAKRARR